MKSEIKNLLIICFVFIIFAILNYGQCGNVLIDFSREIFIPNQINSGQAPFRDIFIIYGLFGYVFNSFLAHFSNINLYFLESITISFGLAIVFYFISRSYLNKKESLLLSLFFITLNVFSTSTFNLSMPYSYSTLWAYFGAYCLLLCLIKNKQTLAMIFLGFIAINRVELFILLILPSIFYLRKYKNFNFKKIFYVFPFIFLALIYILFEKIEINYIVQNYKFIKNMVQTPAIEYFYKSLGVYFYKEFYIYNLKNIIIFFSISFISYFLFKKNQKFLSYFVLIALFMIIKVQEALNLGILLLIIPFGFFILQKKFPNKKKFLLLIFGIIMCLKSIFNINHLSYTNYGYPILLLGFYVLFKFILNKKWLFNFVLIFGLILNFYNMIYSIKNKKVPFKTRIGTIYLNKNHYDLFNQIDEYFKNNLKKEDSLLVVPEGQIFNLIYDKKYPYYYSTFTPLDFDTFSEEKIISDINNNKPTYILFYPRNTKEYGAQTICYDYAIDFCTYIMDNYTRIEIFESKYKALLFKKIK